MKLRNLLVFALLLPTVAGAGMAEHIVRTRVGGADLILYPTDIRDVVTIAGSLPAGDAFAVSGNPAVATLTGMMLDKGTRTADKYEIARRLESVGASISFSVEEQTLSIRAKCLRKDVPVVLQLLIEQLRAPAFSVEEFAKVQKQMNGAMRRALENTNFRASDAFTRAIYPAGHPNRPASAADMLAAVDKATLEEVRQFHARHYGPAHLTLVMVGDLDVHSIRRQLAKDLFGWSGGVAALVAPKAAVPGAPSVQSVEMADKTSISVLLGQPTGLRYSDADALALRVGTAIFGSGFTGRLMKTVRDQEGLTYGIASYLDGDTFSDGDWRIEATFAPQLIDQGVSSARRELAAWWQRGVTAEELAARKTDLVGTYKVQLATTNGLASQLLRTAERGKPLTWLDDYPRAVQALTLEQVNVAIHAHLDPQKMVLVEAGTLPKP